MLLSSLLSLLPLTLVTYLTQAAPPKSVTPAALPSQSLNGSIACQSRPDAAVIPADCNYLLQHLSELAPWTDEYINFGVLEPGGRETPIWVHSGFCQLGVLARSPREREIDRFRLKDYMQDLMLISSLCLLAPRTRWNAGTAEVGDLGRFYAYLGAVPYKKKREGVAQG